MPKQVGGTVWQAAVARVGGVRGCCGHLCQCGAALLLLLLFSSTEISSSSSSDEIRRGVGSPEPGHRAQHRPEWGLLHLHLQLGSLQRVVRKHIEGKINKLTCKGWPMTICPPPASTTARRESETALVAFQDSTPTRATRTSKPYSGTTNFSELLL